MRKMKCDSCHVEFYTDRTDEEAEQEAKEIWGEIPEENKATICHNCFELVMKVMGKSESVH